MGIFAPSGGYQSYARAPKAFAAVIASAALVVSGLVVTAAPAAAAGGTDGTVSGEVFQDFSSSGWYTTGAPAAGIPRSRPVAGVMATAYDAQGDVVGSAVSAADGSYAIGVADAYSSDLRVEFSDWPAQYEPAFAAQGVEPPSTIGANDTSVQFVTLDASGSAADVDFGLVIPDQVIQNDAPLATAIQYAGLPAATAKDLSAIVAQPWSAVGSSDDPNHFDKRTEVASFGEVGSVWGLSYNRTGNFLVAAASLKRMSGMGDLGIDGIYGAVDVLNPDGSTNPAASIVPWFELSDVGIDVGTVASNTARGLGDANAPAYDEDGFRYSARRGVGGIATSLDGNTLFVTNLYDRQVYGIDISGGAVTPARAWKVPTPVGVGQQLWALTVYQDRLYMGYVDTGDDPQGAAQPGQAASALDMQAYVVSAPIADAVAGVVAAGDWRLELQTSLGYDKGSNLNDWPNTEVGSKPQLHRWNSWTDQWRWAPSTNTGSVGFNTGWGLTQAYPQPILSGLAFDIDGYLNLGFADRTSLQGGNLNVAADPSVPGFFETVANGEILVAAPVGLGIPSGPGCPAAAAGNFALECNGKVGDRPVRTSSAAGQGPTYDNDQGPATGEFFNDSQNRGLGGIHNENTLGSVATYPGVDEVATTAIDPGPGLYRSGVMWFDQRNGTATRYFDQVKGKKDNKEPAFQKGGGLGSVALLGVAAPVEIGNRVWLDADLNGRQDADEPAIDGAVVELWTADAQGNPDQLVGTRTTATIDGQPGTYYFRSDDPDIMADPDDPAKPAFVDEGEYVLVFKAGDTLTLGGPNAGNPGFTGLAWRDLRLTSAQVRIAPTPTNGGTTAANDSNPDPATGEFAIEVGGPGENDHTYDAGWYGLAPYQVLKTVSGPGPEGATYDVEVTSAVNFRGEDRLTQAGADPNGRDPRVEKTAYELTPGVAQKSEQTLPFGYTLEFAEVFAGAAPPDASIAFTPSVSGSSPPKGRLVISPSSGGELTLDVANRYGSLQVAKTLSGDSEAIAALEGFAFTVNWTSDTPDVAGGETSGSFTVTGDGTPSPDPALAFPSGAVVTLTETPPAGLPAGVAWTGLEWTAAPNVAVSQDSTTATVTILAGEGSATTAGLTNTVRNLLGGFTVEKALTGDFTLDDPELANVSIPVDYSYRDAGTGQTVDGTLTLNPANGFAATGPTLPTGTVVTLEEGTPTGAPPNVAWGRVGWSVDGGASQAQPVRITVGDGTAAALVVTNEASEVSGTFQVTKAFSGDFPADDPQLADVAITVGWTAGEASGEVELTQAGGWTATPTDADGQPVVFPLGTVVTLTETGRTGGPPNLEWGEVSWGANANPQDPAQGLVTVSNQATPAAITLTNGTIELLGTFSVAKQVAGDFDLTSPELADAQFAVTATWQGGSQQLVLNQANGWASGLGMNLPTGTVVTLSEAVPSGTGPSVEWGADPAWSGDGVTPGEGGTATIAIGDGTSPRVTVTNRATELRGTFAVAKSVSGDLALTDPQLAGAVFTVAWTSSDGQSGSFELSAPDWAAGPVAAEAPASFPLGTTVTLSEPAISGTGPAVQWGGVTWSGGDQGDGTAVVTISSDTEPLALTLTNQVTALTGTFAVEKALSGDFDFSSPELQGASFTVRASWPAAPGLEAGEVELVLDADGEWSAPAGVDLPTGTVVTLSEVAIAGTGPSVEWGDVTWSGEGIGVGDDGTASFVVGDNTAPTFTLTNRAAELTGGFSIAKRVTGPVAAEVPDDFVFTVTYTYAGLPQPATLTVRDGETVTSPQIPTGTEVTIAEVRPEGGVPAGAGWGNPVFVLPDGTTATGGATITIGNGEVVAIGLENPTIPALPPTGAVVPWLAAGLAAALVAVGAAMLAITIRRRRKAEAA